MLSELCLQEIRKDENLVPLARAAAAEAVQQEELTPCMRAALEAYMQGEEEDVMRLPV